MFEVAQNFHPNGSYRLHKYVLRPYATFLMKLWTVLSEEK